MWTELFEITWAQTGAVVLAAVFIYITLITFSRLVGPRSFAQMTAFDFAVTVALGAIVGATATGGVRFIDGFLGLSVLFALRLIVAVSRPQGLSRLVDNSPVIVMVGQQVLSEHLERSKLTEEDLTQSLRKAGITSLSQVELVVMERDGSISVMRSGDSVDPYLLQHVTGYEQYESALDSSGKNVD